MALSQDLLDILACPACKSTVELKPDGNALKCVACKRVYPIRDDIPVMLITAETAGDWLSLEAVHCVGGSWIVRPGETDLGGVAERARHAAALA